MGLKSMLGNYAQYRGLRGGIKGMAALAIGRWLYGKWQANRTGGTQARSY